MAHLDDLVLVAGVIADPMHADQFSRLLHQLLGLMNFQNICSLDVVVLHNGGPEEVLERIIVDYRARGLAIFLALEHQQIEDARQGTFGLGFTRPLGRAPIAPARTMLQTYVTRVANHRPGAIAWILDDDVSLDNLYEGLNPLPFQDLLSRLRRLQSFGVDVVLGGVTGDPPVPPGSTVRTQLVDLYYNLMWLLKLDPDSELPDRSADNRSTRAATKDFYYDLSRRDTHHLEWPFWLARVESGETVRAALARMITGLPRILAGQAVFRPILLDTDHDAIASIRPSVQRGTNTFVFDLRAFVDFPNAAPNFAGSTLRRSDMIWALLNRYAGGRRIVGATLPVRHDRSSEAPVGLDLDRLLPDIRGYALYSALEDVLVRRRERRLREGIGAEEPDDLKFREADLDFAVSRFRKYLTERTAALLLSCWRIQGLCKTISRLVGKESDPTFLNPLLAFLDKTRSCFAVDRINEVVDGVVIVSAEEIKSFVRNLAKVVDHHRKAKILAAHEDSWFHGEREAAARQLAIKISGTTSLRLLGAGGEGVVFASADTVIKVIDYSKRSTANGARDGVTKLAAFTSPLATLYRLILPKSNSGRQVICYPLDPSNPYCGGHAIDILQLLRDCRSAGVVTTNLHPKNLIVTPNGVRLIDYGSDIRDADRVNYFSMVKRAWLTLRYSERQDLSNLMRQALHDDSIPELEGWEALLAAIDAPSQREVIDEALLDIVRQWKPHRVLDFGCGHGRLAAILAATGTDVFAFDPNDNLRARWNQIAETNGLTVRWLTGHAEHALSQLAGSFDVVICSLVLCVIESDTQYQAALQNISNALSFGGRFVVVVCNPAATLEGDSTLQRRFLPVGATSSQMFTWLKKLNSGSERWDVHRPLSQLTKDLNHAGLNIKSITSTGGISLRTLEPSRDYLVISGRKDDGASASHCIPSTSSRRTVHSRSGNPPVLCYHRVLPDNQNDSISAFHRLRGTVVDLTVFQKQLDDICNFFTPISLELYHSWLNGIASLPHNACLLTFDDGYRDFLDFALPEMRTQGVPCVLFATISAARSEELLPVDTLYTALSHAEREGSLNPEQILDWAMGFNKQRYIRASAAEQRCLLAEAGLQQIVQNPTTLYLKEEEIIRLPSDLVSIGGHGCRHELLADKEVAELRKEFRKVRFWLESLNQSRGSPELTISYPNGSHDPLAIAIAIEAGFSSAFTVEPWRPGRHGHRWRLSRSCVPNRLSAIAELATGGTLSI